MTTELPVPFVAFMLLSSALFFGFYGLLLSLLMPGEQTEATREVNLRIGRIFLTIALVSAFAANFWRNP